MPLGEVPYAANEDLLDAGEIEAVVEAAASIGFRRIRFTGGEPTLRQDLVEIVERCARVDGIHDIAMTTNGMLLPPLAEPLRDAGLNRVNIHVDSLREDTLPQIMRRGQASTIRAGIDAAVAAGFARSTRRGVFHAGHPRHCFVSRFEKGFLRVARRLNAHVGVVRRLEQARSEPALGVV